MPWQEFEEFRDRKVAVTVIAVSEVEPPAQRQNEDDMERGKFPSKFYVIAILTSAKDSTCANIARIHRYCAQSYPAATTYADKSRLQNL